MYKAEILGIRLPERVNISRLKPWCINCMCRETRSVRMDVGQKKLSGTVVKKFLKWFENMQRMCEERLTENV